jgi:hypothetical protein
MPRFWSRARKLKAARVVSKSKDGRGGARAGAGRKPVDGEKMVRSAMYLPASLPARIKAACAVTGMSMSEFVRRAITAALEKMKL